MASAIVTEEPIPMTQLNGHRELTAAEEEAATSFSPANNSISNGDNDDGDGTPEWQYPKGIKLALTSGTVASVLVLTAIDINIVATAVPRITDHFHTTQDVAWYASAFRLCMCAFQFVFARAYVLFAVRRVFLFASAVSVVGAVFCGAATSSAMLVVGRAVSGLAAAGLFSGCFVILGQSLPLRRRPAYMGVLVGIEGSATLAAPIIGGALTQSLGWRWCFWVSPPVAVLTMVLTVFFVAEKPKPAAVARLSLREKVAGLDLASNLIVLPALVMLFLALSWAGTRYTWDSAAVLVPLVAFAVLLSGFGYAQYRLGDAAALPARVLKRRSVIAGFIFVCCTNSASNVLEYYLPTYYQVVRGYNPGRSGYMMLPIVLSATVGGVLHGIGTSVFGYYAPFMLFASVSMPIACGLVTTFTVDTDLTRIILITAFAGLAYGIGFSGPQNAVQTVLSEEDVPLGVAIMLFAQSFGPAVAIAVAQVLFTNRLSANLGDLVPSLARNTTVNTGLTGIVTSVPSNKMRDALVGVDMSLTQTLYLVVGLACTTMIGSCLIEWRSVKEKKD